MPLRYILFHHQTTTILMLRSTTLRCVISSFITKPQLFSCPSAIYIGCVISSFITKPQLKINYFRGKSSCVISSFITKPQLSRLIRIMKPCCVISSFITKPQLSESTSIVITVALYPLSSPNHNLGCSPSPSQVLRYILFHHQTTTQQFSTRT